MGPVIPDRQMSSSDDGCIRVMAMFMDARYRNNEDITNANGKQAGSMTEL